MMIESRYCFRNPGQTKPQLGFAESFWALTARPLSIAESLEAACAEGCEYFEVGLREERMDQARLLLKQFPLRLIAQGWAVTREEALVFVERAAELNAVALNMHLGHAYMTADEARGLIEGVQEAANLRGLPMLLETHRGRLTQDLAATSRLMASLPELPVTLDVSHYLVAGETLGGDALLFRKYMEPLAARTALIHGRVSNGQAVQVRLDDEFAFTSLLRGLWTYAMTRWLAEAPADAVFIFEPELGPPPYAYRDGDGEETFDRGEESRKLVALARECWARAQDSALVSRRLW